MCVVLCSGSPSKQIQTFLKFLQMLLLGPRGQKSLSHVKECSNPGRAEESRDTGCQLASCSTLGSAANSCCKVEFGPLDLSFLPEKKDVGQDHPPLPTVSRKSKEGLHLGPSPSSAGARGRRQQTKKKRMFLWAKDPWSRFWSWGWEAVGREKN